MKRLIVITYFLLSIVGLAAQEQEIPAVPPENVTSSMDFNQIKQQLGISLNALPTKKSFYEDFLLPKYHSLGLDITLGPSRATQPDGNWTMLTNNSKVSDNLAGKGTTIVSSQGGIWNNYIQSWEPGGDYLTGEKFYRPLELMDVSGLSAAEWPKRRAEIFDQLQNELYGRIPEGAKNLKIEWSTSGDTTGVSAGVEFKQYNLTGTIDVSSYPEVRNKPVISCIVRLPTDKQNTKDNVPVVIAFGGWLDQSLWEAVSPLGIGVVCFNINKLQPDNGAGLTSYLIGLVNKGNWRKPDDWGTLVAWSWGVSRLIDHFQEKNSGIDAKRVGLTGHSRYGKATLVTMAYEKRLAIAFPSSSGSLGAVQSRRHWGQDLEHSASESEYHWMAGNFMKYIGVHNSSTDGYMPRKVMDLKVDAECLVALCAPRPIFIGVGSSDAGDSWADPYGQYLVCRLASPVYELLGKKGVQMTDSIEYEGRKIDYPVTDKAYLAGDIAFRRHSQGHVATPNYPTFALFMAKYFFK